MAAQALILSVLGLTGTVEPGGLLYSYVRSTTTPLALYTDSGLTTPATNPVVANALGTISVYFNDALSYSLTCKTADQATTLFQFDIVGGVVALTYVNPDYVGNPIINTSWVPVLQAAIGSNWGTALGTALGSGWAAILAAANMPIVYVDTYAALQALTAGTGRANGGVYYVKGRTGDNDGGQGHFLYSSASSATSNSGTILLPGDSAGRYIRLYDGTIYPEFFGSSSDWGAALTAAFTAVASSGGIVKMRPGSDYTFTTQATMPATENFVVWDIRGCKIRPKYASGATFKFGDGATQVNELQILGGAGFLDAATVAEGGVSQPVFEFRGVRSVRMEGVFGSSFYQIAKWGDPADAVSCYQWWMENCDITMRTNANGGHTHAILGDGSAGGLYLTDTYVEADAVNLASAVNFVHLTSAQGPARLDHISFQGGNIKGFDRVCSAVDARIVNMESDSAARFDVTVEAVWYIEATSGASKGGVESIRAAGTVGGNGTGTYSGPMVRIKADKSSAGITFEDIIVHDTIVGNANGAAVHVSTSGSGVVKSVHVRALHMADADPASATIDGIILDGDIDEASVDGVSIQHKSGASNTMRYGVYNNTASTKSVRIGTNIMMDTYGTGVVYDPNVGDLSIGRFCAINSDGSPRRAHKFDFVGANFAAGVTNGDMTIQHASGFVATTLPAPRRGRVIEFGGQLTGTILTNTIVFGPWIGGALDTNLDVSLSSSDGASPDFVVRYIAGSSEVAEGASLASRYTTHASLTPTTLDAAVFLVFQEM